MHPHSEHCHGHAKHAPLNLPGMTADENSPPALRAYIALKDACRAQRYLVMRRLAEEDSHPGQAVGLMVLAANDGITQSELADMIGIARPTVTTMLQKMERAGLIERRVDEDDQRYTRIYVTDAGHTLHERLRDVHDEMVLTAMGPLSEVDQLELERLLLLVSENIERGLA